MDPHPLAIHIQNRVQANRAPKVYVPKDFLDLGTREAVDQALSRLVRAQHLARLGRGLYYLPRQSPRMAAPVVPDPDEIADALARQTGARIAPSGATAANRLGLSTQVPAKLVYLTDGRSRQVRVGKALYVFKHVPPKDLPLGNRLSATVLQALRYFGQEGVNAQVRRQIRKQLSPTDRTQLQGDARYATDWVADTVRQIVAASNEATHG